MKKKPLCFVVMGFGKKWDPLTNKVFDLDVTYKKIIKPAAEQALCDVVRADEIMESNLIDVSMYTLIYKADVVIADIATLNPNVMYELGIRHAFKRRPTIIIKDDSCKIPFDINHSRIFTLTHSETSISSKIIESEMVKLSRAIMNILSDEVVDSPTYTYMPTLREPSISEADLGKLIGEIKQREESIYALTNKANELKSNNQFQEAAEYWEKLHEKDPDEPFYIQQQALCTYKKAKGSDTKPFIDALQILNLLKNDSNPETLGLYGAIYKNLYLITKEELYLQDAIDHYEKGWNQRDYYTGENYAICLLFKAVMEKNSTDDRNGLFYMAKYVFKQIIPLVLNLIEEIASDKMWLYATLSNSYYAIGETKESEKYERIFLTFKPKEWEVSTFMRTKSLLLNLNK